MRNSKKQKKLDTKMTAHELAKILLSGPNDEVSILTAPGVTDWLHGIHAVGKGLYSVPSYDDNGGEKIPVIVLVATETTLQEDEKGTELDLGD